MHTNLVREGFLAYRERLPSAAHSSADTCSQGSVFHDAEPYGAGSCNSTGLYIDYIYLPLPYRVKADVDATRSHHGNRTAADRGRTHFGSEVNTCIVIASRKQPQSLPLRQIAPICCTFSGISPTRLLW